MELSISEECIISTVIFIGETLVENYERMCSYLARV